MEGGDAQEGFHDSRAGDVRLVEPGLPNPAAHVEGIGEADQDVDGGQEERSGSPGRETPRKEGQRKDGDAVRRQGDGMIAEPAATEGDMAVLLVHVEPMDLPAEKNGEEKVGELVGERHHPADVPPDAGDDETHEERDETDTQVSMQPNPPEADRL